MMSWEKNTGSWKTYKLDCDYYHRVKVKLVKFLMHIMVDSGRHKENQKQKVVFSTFPNILSWTPISTVDVNIMAYIELSGSRPKKPNMKDLKQGESGWVQVGWVNWTMFRSYVKPSFTTPDMPIGVSSEV